MNPFVAIGGIVNSALFLLLLFVAALVSSNLVAVVLVITAVGVTFLSYAMQGWCAPLRLIVLIHILSIWLGALALIALIAGYSIRGWAA